MVLFLLLTDGYAETLRLDKIKANFILGICDFSTWVPPEEGRKIIGIIGAHNLFQELQLLLNSIDGLKDDYEIVQVREATQLDGMHIVYVGEGEEDNWYEILAIHQQSRLLTIGVSDMFFQKGGAVQFLIDKNQLKFNINLQGIPQHVHLSSKLMQLSNNL